MNGKSVFLLIAYFYKMMVDAIDTHTYVLHSVDFDPEIGGEGGNRILTEEYGDMSIESYNTETRTITASHLNSDNGDTMEFHLLPNTRSDIELFRRTVVAKWNLLKDEWEDVDEDEDEGDEDYISVYENMMPAIYHTFSDMINGEIEIITE